MSYIEFFVTFAGGILASITAIIYFCRSGTNLESRISSMIKEKKQIISNSYLEIVEKIIERFKTSRTLPYELEEKLEHISYTRFQLRDLPNKLSNIVDKLTRSVVFGIFSAFFSIIFAYIPELGVDSTISSAIMIIIGIALGLCLNKYVQDGLVKMDSLRDFQKLVNKLERCETFNQLFELL